MPLWQLNLSFVSFIAMGVSGIAITLAVKRYYRCPRCDSVPLGSWTPFGPGNIGVQWGVAVNPAICSKCGAILR
jgi:transcription elongation factor Elf1